MSQIELDRTSRRILGVLVEKELTTPNQYPMSVNAIVDACNQKSARDPIMHVQEFEVEGALRSLFVEQWVTNMTVPGGRTLKWKHRLGEKLALTEKREFAVMAELLLRGPQQPGELRSHAQRMFPFPELESLEQTANALLKKGLVIEHPRRPGERASRYDHRLYPAGEVAAPSSIPLDESATDAFRTIGAMSASPTTPARDRLSDRIEELEERLEKLERRLDALEGRG